MIELIIVLLIILWLGGLFLHIAGSFIHILLAAAVILFFLRIFTMRY
ncbi:MAG: lmo0937 family membrane protein [Actinobacteria bacterium]|nr:lmo0937 family membrane protein [Actinomycetota bacterium]